MTDKDKLFKFYGQGEIPANPDDMAYIMWSEDSVFNFSHYSYAYRQAAEALYEQFVNHNGDNAMKDPMGITLTFIYRHYMELTTKFLYMKFFPYIHGRRLSDEEIASFIEKTGHNLNEIWKELKPILTELSMRLRTSFDIKAFGHYISEFRRFDESSMKMRYPMDKEGKAFETKSQRLDIKILHDRMDECMNEVDKLVGQWDYQIYWADDEEQGNLFIEQFKDAMDDVERFLVYEASYVEAYKQKHAGGMRFHSLSDVVLKPLPEEMTVVEFLKSMTDNHLLVIHNLYYIGSRCLRRIMVWKKVLDRQMQFTRSAGLICRSETNKFNAPMDRTELIGTIMSKMPETFYNSVKGCVDMYKRDWGV